ncbi:MAG: peptidoglycan synthetase [Paludibacteraceae bacterium]|nr:peptidoglycan synthetase [Paludibacteraceae bacterium]
MKKVHFIAIGGAAMHNLALALNDKDGYQITGSDDEFFDPSKSRLEAAGLLPEKAGWFPERITPDLDAVILGMHAREDNPELIKAKELGLKVYSFPEYLYEQTKDKKRVVIGGSHGKTTTTSMILFVLKEAGIKADYMVGAQIEGFKNMVSLSNDAEVAVFEGDEYLTSPIDLRSKFLLYHPHIALLTGIAWDHVNVFPTFPLYVDTFRKFVASIEPDGKFIYFAQDENLQQLAKEARADVEAISYDTPQHTVANGVTTISADGVTTAINVFGDHNLQNIMGAYKVCLQLGISTEDFFRSISKFKGAANRLQKIAESDNAVAFKDFAHSPSKLKATVHAVKSQFPDRQLVACMELHTFSSLTKSFLPQYENAMAEADKAFVYFNPEVIKHKRLEAFTVDDVRKAFGGDNLTVFCDSKELQKTLREIDFHDKTLLMMTSGNFDGVDIIGFSKELLNIK